MLRTATQATKLSNEQKNHAVNISKDLLPIFREQQRKLDLMAQEFLTPQVRAGIKTEDDLLMTFKYSTSSDYLGLLLEHWDKLQNQSSFFLLFEHFLSTKDRSSLLDELGLLEGSVVTWLRSCDVVNVREILSKILRLLDDKTAERFVKKNLQFTENINQNNLEYMLSSGWPIDLKVELLKKNRHVNNLGGFEITRFYDLLPKELCSAHFFWLFGQRHLSANSFSLHNIIDVMSNKFIKEDFVNFFNQYKDEMLAVVVKTSANHRQDKVDVTSCLVMLQKKLDMSLYVPFIKGIAQKVDRGFLYEMSFLTYVPDDIKGSIFQKDDEKDNSMKNKNRISGAITSTHKKSFT